MRFSTVQKESAGLISRPPLASVLQRKCACGQHTIAGGTCDSCSEKNRSSEARSVEPTRGRPSHATAHALIGLLGEQVESPVVSKPSGELRMSRVSGANPIPQVSGMRIGPPGDSYEREADRVAASVMAQLAVEETAQPVRTSSAGSLVQSHPNTAGSPETGHDSVPVQAVLREAGQPLPAVARNFFEPRFGHDFSQVRVHTDERAAQTAGALGADAYTVGHHVVFGPQRFAPTTPSGQSLLAHELSHVLQQTGGSATPASGSGSRLVQRHTSFSAAEQTAGSSLGWKHPGGSALLVSDDGKLAVENLGWKNSKKVWALDALIKLSNGILSSQGSRVRMKTGASTISGKPPNVPAGTTQTLNAVEVESSTGGALTLTGDCGYACKEVMGSPTDPEKSVAVTRTKGIEGYTKGRTYEARDSSHALGTTEEWSEEIYKKEFGAGLTRAEALKKYDDLSADKKLEFDEKYGTNKFAAPKVGQGVTISTEYDMPGFGGNPGKSTWNFHFATAVLASGDDYVSLENIARRADTAWFFWMYGPLKKAQTFHEFQGAMKEHGTRFTTMVVQPDKILDGVIDGDGVHLVADPDIWKTSLKAKLARGTEVRVLAKGQNWRKVEVRSGPEIGKIGWIMSTFFKIK